MRQLTGALALTLLASGAVPGQGAEPGAGRRLGELDVARIRELHHITGALGEKLWPGYRTRDIPIAVNCDDRQELLIGHPSPPAGYTPFGDHRVAGKPVLIRDGVSRFGPRGGGWAVDLGGEQTGYVSVLQKGQSTERYLSLLLHECFHVYQKRYRPRGAGPFAAVPSDDPVYAAMLGLESRVLFAALEALDGAPDEPGDDVAGLCRTFVAVRLARRAPLPAAVVRNEGELEYSEGTATYVQARLYRILSREFVLEPRLRDDPRYKAFAGAAASYRLYRSRVLAGAGQPIAFIHAQYNHGMAQCLLLDRVRPGWKKEMRVRGRTQFDLLAKQFPLETEARDRLVAAARERFDYADLLAGQRRLVEARLARIRSLLHAKGRRYRIYHSAIPGRFRWKPKGPVHTVPASMLGDEGEAIVIAQRGGGSSRILNPKVTIWEGGIRRFEKGDLVLETKAVPVIFRPDYLEWIDPDPDPAGRDLRVRSAREVDGVHHDARIETDGFTLRGRRLRIETADGVVTIRPVDQG